MNNYLVNGICSPKQQQATIAADWRCTAADWEETPALLKLAVFSASVSVNVPRSSIVEYSTGIDYQVYGPLAELCASKAMEDHDPANFYAKGGDLFAFSGLVSP